MRYKNSRRKDVNHKIFILILLVAVLLAGCTTGGPSNAEAKEVIYGVHFADAKIIEKRQCELTPRMEEEGLTNVWLIRYKLEDSGNESGMLLAETDSEEYPWDIYRTQVDSCPSE
jgi:hypothetical protein